MRLPSALFTIALLVTGTCAHSAPENAAPVKPQIRGFFPCLAYAGDALFADERARCQQEALEAVNLVKDRYRTIAADPAAAGCIGKDAATCIATLGQQIIVSTNGLDPTPFRIPIAARLDIDGHPLRALVQLQTVAEGASDPSRGTLTTLSLDDGVHVSSVEFLLPTSPLLAQTEDEWRGTGTFQFATAVLGPSCVGQDALAFYRKLRTAERGGSVQHSIDDSYSDPGVSSGVTGAVHICGYRIDVGDSAGVSAEVGSYAAAMMTISKDNTQNTTASKPQ